MSGQNKEGLILTSISEESIREIISTAIVESLKNVLANNPVSQEQSVLLNRNEAAKLLGVSLPTLSKWTKEGRIPAHRIASRVRYKRAELIDSLAKMNVPRVNKVKGV